jgi:hypothetical protein
VIFAIDGTTYDTHAMRRFDVPGRVSMAVYVNERQRCAFVQTFDSDTGVVLRRATTDQLEFFARTYKIPELLEYLPLQEC